MAIMDTYSQSRMTPFDEHALHDVCRLAAANKPRMDVLEIGSWFGAGSTRVFSDYARRIVCVDTWLGNENSEHEQILKEVDPLQIFIKNTEPLACQVIPIRMTSEYISELLRPSSFDLIFIDGDHRYNQTKSDIVSCIPLLRDGGILAGHDCEEYLDQVRDKIQGRLCEDHIDSLNARFRHMHPGVIQAVGEIFGRNISLYADPRNLIILKKGLKGYSTIWYHKHNREMDSSYFKGSMSLRLKPYNCTSNK